MKKVIFITILLMFNIIGFTQIPYNQDLIIEDITFGNGDNYTYEAVNSITSPSIESKPVYITGSAQVEYTAGQVIRLKPGFRAGNFSNGGYFRARIKLPDIAYFYPNNPNEVGKYEKFEIGVNISDEIKEQINNFFDSNYQNGLNPFNPNDIKIETTFISPSGTQFKRYGFYYEDYTINANSINYNNTNYKWRIRFSPNEIGDWAFSIKIIANGFNPINKTGYHFTCVNSNKKGPVEIYKNYFRYKESKKMFFMIGENQTWDYYSNNQLTSYKNHIKWIEEDAQNGANSISLSYTRWDLAIEGSVHDNLPVGIYNLKNAYIMDKLYDKSEQLDIYIKQYIIHHSFIYNDDAWLNNPYRQIENVNEQIDFFTNENAKEYFKNYLFYLIARWGYSSNILYYELLSEINWLCNLDNDNNIIIDNKYNVIKNWSIEIANYIKNLNNKYISVNYAESSQNDDVVSNSYKFYNNNIFDVTQVSYYGYGEGINRERYNKVQRFIDFYKKPFVFSETGCNEKPDLDACNKITFHNSIWSITFSRSAGTGFYWWWDNAIHPNNFHKDYKPLSKFLESENFLATSDGWAWYSVNIKGSGTNNILHNGTDKLFENFYLKYKKSKVRGWIHNRSANWYSKHTCIGVLSQNDANNAFDGGDTDDDPDKFRILKNSSNKIFRIRDLEKKRIIIHFFWWETINKYYRVSWFNTETGNICKTETVKTNTSGTLKLKYPICDNDDIAYKIDYLYSDKSLKIDILFNENDTVNNIYDFEKQNIEDKIVNVENIDFTIYPNPSQDKITIKSNENINFTINIFNIQGICIFSKNSNNTEIININNWQNGIYIIKINYNNNFKTFKLTKQ